MILPTKHISLEHSLLGAGAVILEALDSPRSTSALWDRVRSRKEVGVYWRFVLALDFLFALGAIGIADGILKRANG